MNDVIAETESGRVRGMRRDGVLTFYGVPYGASTAGENRFRAPKPPRPWTGIRDATTPGPIAPQHQAHPGNRGRTDEPMSEDCLRVNLWTPALTGARPVVVWLHGGGFAVGKAHGSYADGDALARRGDVVAVNVSHRLSMLGFLHLEELFGEEFAGSGNAGMLDVIAAVRWVRRNARSFGGDPDDITVHGHSGGGGKVASLAVMPAARGLIRRAAVHGGPPFGHKDSAAATDNAERALAALGVRPGRPEELAALSVHRILDAQWRLGVHGGPGPHGMRFAPVSGTRALPADPYVGFAAGAGRGIQLMTGTSLDESRAAMFAWPYYADYVMPEDDLIARIAPGLDDPGDAEELVARYRSLDPGASNTDVFFALTSDQFRVRSLRLAAAKEAGDGEGSWVYLCATDQTSPQRAFHGVQMPMFFARGRPGSPSPAIDETVAEEFIRYVHGELPRSPRWRPRTAAEPTEFFFDDDAAESRRAPLSARDELWDGVILTPRTDPWTTLWRGPHT